MDSERQIRFLYPPLILMGSILLGISFDETTTLDDVITYLIGSNKEINTLTALLGATSLILVIGFVLGTITIVSLKLLCFKNGWDYEIWLKEGSYTSIGKLILKDSDRIEKEDRLYASVTFDHAIVPKAVHDWIARRWNSFFVSSNSTTALIMSLALAPVLNIDMTCGWVLITLLFIIIFGYLSYLAWRQTMRMIEFQIRVEDKNLKGNN